MGVKCLGKYYVTLKWLQFDVLRMPVIPGSRSLDRGGRSDSGHGRESLLVSGRLSPKSVAYRKPARWHCGAQCPSQAGLGSSGSTMNDDYWHSQNSKTSQLKW